MGARLPGWKYRINFSLIEVPKMIIRTSSLSVRRVRRMNWSYGCTIPKECCTTIGPLLDMLRISLRGIKIYGL